MNTYIVAVTTKPHPEETRVYVCIATNPWFADEQVSKWLDDDIILTMHTVQVMTGLPRLAAVII